MKKDDVKLFLRFLKEKKIYNKWRHNVIAKHSLYFNLYSRDPFNVLLSSFYWVDTEEGWNFWDEINDKWCKTYKKVLKYFKNETN